MSINIVVKSTMLLRRNVHKYTWTSPNGKTHNQTDYVLIDRSCHSSLDDVRSFRRTDSDTDHYLVVAKVTKRLSVSKKEARKFDVARFNKAKWAGSWQKKYRNKMSNSSAALDNL
jgi:hypothetical protein